MRPAPRAATLAAVVVAAAAAAALLSRRGPGGLDVLLVTIDTLRADHLGCYGYGRARTPTMDRLAAEGALFEDAACSAPLTLPSHATILTGLHPPRHGLRDNDTPRAMPAREGREFLLAAEAFRDAGYRTGAFVSGSPLSPRWGLDAGFDAYDAPPEGEPGALALGERSAAETVDRALGFLRQGPAGTPVFAWVHLFDPHEPYHAPYGAGFAPDSVEAYDEEIAYADGQLGRLVESLRAAGTLDRTVLVVCADHGEGLGEHGEATHGYFLHRSTVRVPLLVRFRPRATAGTRVREPVSLADVFPTLLDLAGRPAPGYPLDGRPLLPAAGAASAAASTSAAQYSEALEGWRAFRWAQAVALRTPAAGTSLRVIDHGGGRREVHDLAADPGETADLSRAGGPAADAAARAAADAWALFGGRALWRSSAGAPDPGIAGIGYVTAYSPVRILGAEESGRLPLPSAAFLGQFLGVLRSLERAREAPEAADRIEQADAVHRLLAEMEREDPANPALAFWDGRALRQKAQDLGEGMHRQHTWLEAFERFREAGRRGYRDPRTVSLMLHAAYEAGDYGDMGLVARDAVEAARMDGDSWFWGWIALARARAAQAAHGALLPEDRGPVEAALARAEERCRTDEDRARIRELRGQIDAPPK